MADTVQRLGIEFFGRLDEKSISDVADKIKEVFANKKISDVIPSLSANFSTFAKGLKEQLETTTKSLSDATTAVAKIGSVTSEVGRKMGEGFGKAKTGATELTTETTKLIALTKQLSESFAKIDFTNMIKPDQMEMFRSKFIAINKQVEAFTVTLSKIAKPEFSGIQQEALAVSKQIDNALKSLSTDISGGKAMDTPARIQEIVDMIKQLRSIGGSALASEFGAGTESLKSFGIEAGMSAQQVSKLQIGLLELNKVKGILAEQITNVKSQFEGLDKSTNHYDSVVQTLNQKLIGLMKTEQSVNSVISEKKASIQDIIPVVGQLEAAFNKINMLDQISPPEIHKAAEAWKVASENLNNYMNRLSNLMSFSPAQGTETEILSVSKQIEAKIHDMQVLSQSPVTADNTNNLKIAQVEVKKLLESYTALERTMLSDAIEKTNVSLANMKIKAGDTYTILRKTELSTLQLEKAADLLKTQIAQLRAQYDGLGKITSVNSQQAKVIEAQWGAWSKTLDAVNQKLKVNHGTLADASRGIRMYWEGFAPMLKSQTAWLVGGALLFGTMYKIQDAVRNYLTFEDRLNRIKIVGEGTTAQMSLFRQQLLGLAEESGQMPAALAEASFYLVKFGLTVGQVNEALPALVRLTTVAGGTIQENAKGVITIMNAFHMSFDKTAHVADAMNMALNRSALEMADLSSITSTVANSAAQFNQPLEQILALAASLSNLGVVPSTIGTSIRQLLGTLAQTEAPTQKFIDNVLIKMTKALGSHKAVIDALNPSQHSLVEILNKMGEAGLTAANVYQGLNIRTAGGVLAMLNAKDSLKSLANEIEVSSILTSQYVQTLDSANMSLQRLGATLEATLMKILGIGAERGIADLVKIITSFLSVVGYLNTGLAGVVVHIVGVAAGVLMLLTNLKLVTGTFALGLTGMNAWIVGIFALVSGLNLLVQFLTKFNVSAEDSNKALLSSIDNRSKEIKEIRAQIYANDQLVKAKLLERTEAEKLTDSLRRQLGIKEKLRESDLQAIRQSMFEEARKNITNTLAIGGHYGGQSAIGGNLPPNLTPAFSRMPFLTNKEDAQRWASYNQDAFKKVMDSIYAMDEVSRKIFFKTPGMAWLEWLDQYYQEVLKAKKALEPQSEEDKKADIEHARKMADLRTELNAIINKNNATLESQKIQEDIYVQTKKIAELEKEKQKPATQNDKKELYKIEEAISTEENKQVELSYKLIEARRKEKIANDEYVTSMFKLGIDAEILNKHLERRGKLEYELTSLEMVANQAKTELQNLEVTANAQQSEKDAAHTKYITTYNAVLQKRIEIIQEGYAETERFYTLQEEASARLLEIKLLEIDQSKTLTDKEKEEQKLILQRADIQERILNLGKQLAASNAEDRSLVDISKQEAMLKQLNDLGKDLTLVDLKFKHLEETQKTFWDGLTEYIRQTKTKLDTLWYDMGLEFSNAVEGMIADWGKFIAYQGVASASELKKQADQQTKDLKASYDEQRSALENSYATGQVSTSEYYKQLTDMNTKYNKDISKAQSDYEARMRQSQNILGNLWTKFWQKMVDLAIESLAKMAMIKMQLGLSSLWNGIKGGGEVYGPPTPGIGLNPGAASITGHSGGFVSDIISGLKSYHSGGLNSNEVMAKLLKSEFVLNPYAVRNIGVDNLYHMNRTGQMPVNNIRVFNLMDASSIPTLGPNDVLNIVSFDMAHRGQIYKTLNKGK